MQCLDIGKNNLFILGGEMAQEDAQWCNQAEIWTI